MLAGKKIDPGQKSGQGKTDRELAAIAGASKDLIVEKAKEKQRESGGAVPQKSAKPPIKTDRELAAIAGTSKDLIAAKAKEKKLSKLKKGDKYPDCQNSDEREIDTKKELAAIAGASKDLIAAKAKENLKLSKGRGIKGCQNSDKVIDTKKELACKDLIAAKAKERQIRKPKSVCQNSDKQSPIDTKKELAAIAGKAKGNETGHIYEGFTIQVIANVDYTGLQAVIFPGVGQKF
jgi:hypothetical protein